jgi:hypothetical protein
MREYAYQKNGNDAQRALERKQERAWPGAAGTARAQGRP